MNYGKAYDSLIRKRRMFPINKKCEFHHIIPKACGGDPTSPKPSNNKKGTNLIGLTLREHFIAHRLLEKIYANTKYADQMSYAVQMMAFTKNDKITGKNNGIKITSRQYERFKTEHRKLVKKQMSGRVWINNGKKSKFVYPDKIPTDGKWKIGQLKKTTNRGKILVNNGKDMRMVLPNEIPKGYEIGSIHGLNKKFWIWASNGETEIKVHPKAIPSGFVPGKLGFTKADI